MPDEEVGFRFDERGRTHVAAVCHSIINRGDYRFFTCAPRRLECRGWTSR